MLRHFLLGCCLFASVAAFAQPGLDDNSVTVITNFEARLTEAERVRVTPAPPPADTQSRKQTYSILPRPLNIDYPAPTIKPRAVARERGEAPKNGYAKIGLGVPNAFYGDLSYDLNGFDNVDLGLYAKHYSFNNDGNVENQKSSDTKVGVDGDYLFDQGFAVGAGAEYDTRSRYYYGYNFPEMESDSALSFTADEVRQRFNKFGLHTEIYNGTRTEADFDYFAGINMYILDASPAVRENSIDIDLKATKWIMENSALDLGLSADFTSYKDTTNQTLNNFTFSPSYTTTIANSIKLKVGANLTSQDDDFDIFPDLSLSTPIVDGILSAFVGAEGNLQKNTLLSLSEYNPWIRPRLRIRNTEYTRIYGGIEGNIYGIAYRAEAGYKKLDNLALYKTRRPNNGIPMFDVVYDDGSVTTLQGTATLPVIDNLDLSATIAQRFYSLENEEKPWHLPSFSLNAAGIYTVTNTPLQLRADLFFENGLPYENLEGEADNLNALADLSLSAEFALSDNFSAWGRVNNLLNNKRERFFQYPTIGTNFLLGVSASF